MIRSIGKNDLRNYNIGVGLFFSGFIGYKITKLEENKGLSSNYVRQKNKQVKTEHQERTDLPFSMRPLW